MSGDSDDEIEGELMSAVGPVDFVEDVARIGLDLYGDVPITWRTFRKAVAHAALLAEESAADPIPDGDEP